MYLQPPGTGRLTSGATWCSFLAPSLHQMSAWVARCLLVGFEQNCDCDACLISVSCPTFNGRKEEFVEWNWNPPVFWRAPSETLVIFRRTCRFPVPTIRPRQLLLNSPPCRCPEWPCRATSQWSSRPTGWSKAGKLSRLRGICRPTCTTWRRR